MSILLGCWKFLIAVLVGLLYLQEFTCSIQGSKDYSYPFAKDGTQAPAVSHYDYIIVGGGTVGCPLATTLSQSSKVLLLERGGSPYGNKNISHLTHFMDTLCDLSPGSPSQRFVSEEGVSNARARVLGGGTCLNAGFYSRASSDYVREAGLDGALVNESYHWVEELLVQEPHLLQWQSAVRDGLVEAGVTPYNGFTYDHLRGTKVGGTIFDEEGRRHTAADLLEKANPEGLTVFLHATVHEILFRRLGEPRPVAYGVMFMDSEGTEHRAYLNEGEKNEIIVSAGAIGSPQLLMLSGVGPAEHLISLGIEVVMDQPNVGQGMRDNPMNVILIPSPLPVEISLGQLVGITHSGINYIESISGARYFVCPSDDDGFQSDNLGMLSTKTPSFRGGFILEKVANPLSTGYLKLANKNPDDNPLVTFNYFQEPEDLQACVRGLEIVERVIQSKAFSKFRYPNLSIESLLNMTASFLTDGKVGSSNHTNSLEEYCKNTVMTIWHYHGGCHVYKVVDRDFKVLYIEALRVIDASTFSASPGTNPQATLMMLGRYMGVKIQDERQGRKHGGNRDGHFGSDE